MEIILEEKTSAQVMDQPRKPHKKHIRRSQKALNVANELIYRIRAREEINLKEIAVNNGYSEKSAIAQKPYQTDTFKDAIAPVLEKMKRLHAKAIDNLDSRDLSKERMDSVINLSKQLVHDTRLLENKTTENIGSNVVVYGSEDFLALQMKGSE